VPGQGIRAIINIHISLDIAQAIPYIADVRNRDMNQKQSNREAEMTDYGRIDWMPKTKTFRVIRYIGLKDVPVADYSSRERAVQVLRKIVQSKSK